MRRVRAGGNALFCRPQDCVIVVRGGGHINEVVEHGVVFHEGCRDGHLAGRHGEAVSTIAVLGGGNSLAAFIGDGQSFQRVALVRSHCDGHGRAGACIGGRNSNLTVLGGGRGD